MRGASALLAWLVACAAPARPPVVGPVAMPCPAVPPPAAAPRADPRAATLEAQLARVDGELDAIDVALVAAGRTMSRDAAHHAAATFGPLGTVAVDDPRPPGEPFLLRRIADDHRDARQHVAELSRDLGSQHPQMRAAHVTVARLAREYQAQRDLERAFLRAWSTALDQLPAKATPAMLEGARAAALAAVEGIIRAELRVPSDAPPGVLLAGTRARELETRRLALVDEVGPKHPERIAVEAALAQAARELETALAVARQPGSAAYVDAKLVARRAALAAEALVLRRELHDLR